MTEIAPMNLKQGTEFDGWLLDTPLGRGGNSQVWRATRSDIGEAALKILTRTSADGRARFRDEIAIMTQLAKRQGVLPLLAAEAPKPDTRNRPWLAVPVAQPVHVALGAKPRFSDVLGCARTLTGTLASLASEAIHHRDLKPSNLFRYDETWALGDFGLADFPDKESVTTDVRRLGPLFFVAPEMLRQPSTADGGPADVYSIAKTIWVLVANQPYPPDGQVRLDEDTHDLARYVRAPGARALTLLLQRATSTNPAERPSMADLETLLAEISAGGVAADNRVAVKLSAQYVESLRKAIADSVDIAAFDGIEASLTSVIADARKQSSARRLEAFRAARREAEAERDALIKAGGTKRVLSLHDTVWIGSGLAGQEFADAVLHQPAAKRHDELYKARQILWGRPLWWAHTVALGGVLRLRGEEGCEPLATDIAREWTRHHLLDFGDHPTLAAAWRLQRVLAPVAVRVVARMPLDELSRSMLERIPAAERLKYSIDPGRLMMIHVDDVVRRQLRAVDWRTDALDTGTAEARRILGQLPIPDVTWDGPVTDPWLESYTQYSPLAMCGMAVLSGAPSSDDLLAASDLRAAIETAAESPFAVLSRIARPLAMRLR